LPVQAGLPKGDVDAHRNPEHIDRSLKDEAVANLKAWYKEDYGFIDLCKKLVIEKVRRGDTMRV